MIELDRRQVDLIFVVLSAILLAFGILSGRVLSVIIAIIVVRLILTLERIERNLRTES